MATILAQSVNEQMLRTVEMYLAQGGQMPIDLDELARFAIRNDRWIKRGDVLIQLCKRDFLAPFVSNTTAIHKEGMCGRGMQSNQARHSKSFGLICGFLRWNIWKTPFYKGVI